jgi:hypothetical protein
VPVDSSSVQQFAVQISGETAKSLHRFEQFPGVEGFLQDARRARLPAKRLPKLLLDRLAETPPALNDHWNVPGFRRVPQPVQEIFRTAIRHAVICNDDSGLQAPRLPVARNAIGGI